MTSNPDRPKLDTTALRKALADAQQPSPELAEYMHRMHDAYVSAARQFLEDARPAIRAFADAFAEADRKIREHQERNRDQ